jgi:hypothetical protein
MTLKLLRKEQRCEEIDQHAKSDDTDQDIFERAVHDAPAFLQTFARAGKGDEGRE